MAKEAGNISGLQKAAVLLIALGPERSANVFKHLKEDEIEELTLEIANTRNITPNFIRYVWRSSILQKAVSIMPRRCWRSPLAPTELWM